MEENSISIGRRSQSPLVGDYNRICGDMIAIVEVIAGRPMRAALRRQGCQHLTIFKTNKDLPRGFTGFHLEKQFKGRQ